MIPACCGNFGSKSDFGSKQVSLTTWVSHDAPVIGERHWFRSPATCAYLCELGSFLCFSQTNFTSHQHMKMMEGLNQTV